MSLTISFDLKADLAALNTFLQSRSYLVGFSATQSDVALFNALGSAPDKQKFPNVARFYKHIASFDEAQRANLPAGLANISTGASTGGAAAAAGAAAPAAAAGGDDSDDDLFGSDDDDDGAAAAAAAKKAAENKPKKAKKKAVDRTQLVVEVKPEEAGQDMDALESAVRTIGMEGLTWGEEFKVVDVAYGIQKLIVQCVIEDEKVPLDDVLEPLEALEGVQSVDLATMNRL